MDITSAAMAIKQNQTMSQVQLKVAKKVLDVGEQQGEAAVKLIQAAGELQKQSAQVAGRIAGGGIDVTA